jgi:hypothetical protein
MDRKDRSSVPSLRTARAYLAEIRETARTYDQRVRDQAVDLAVAEGGEAMREG